MTTKYVVNHSGNSYIINGAEVNSYMRNHNNTFIDFHLIAYEFQVDYRNICQKYKKKVGRKQKILANSGKENYALNKIITNKGKVNLIIFKN